jgi:hypothetical protein
MTNVLRIAMPFTIWIIGFSAVYALQGLACSRHWPPGLDERTALIVAAALFIGVQGLVLGAILARPATSHFAQRTATILATAALGAAVWTLLPMLTLTVCS